MNKSFEFKIIDCDVHNELPSPKVLLPYLPEQWKKRVLDHGLGLSHNIYPQPLGSVSRKDSVPPGGGVEGSDPAFLRKQLIEPYNMEYVILGGNDIQNISITPDPDYTAALASAYNDYLIAEWLPLDHAFKGAINVSTMDPAYAAKEIDRVGSHPDMVQVRFASASRFPLGQRYYHPIYEAAARNGLPIAIHPGSEGGGISNPPTAAGHPNRYFEWHTCLTQNFMAQLVSLIAEGVFEKFPSLKFVLTEGGVSWLPHLMWRMDKNYKAFRSTVPWLKKMPSQYIREHCYLTTQPIEEPDNYKDLISIFDIIDAENILLFSSDYPHWDSDAPTHILRGLSKEAKHKIFYENSKTLFKL
jgi:predicted TIM-barrel fold metal-dependent hydrolase